MQPFRYHLPGTAPATLVALTDEKPLITLIEYDRESYERREISDIEECFAYRDNQTITWINIEGLGDLEGFKKLGAHYGLHPLALEDVLTIGQRPKFEEFEQHLFMLLQVVNLDAEGNVTFEQASIFVGKDYVVSIQQSRGNLFEPIRQRLAKGDGNGRKSRADYLAYAILDALVDYYFPVLEALGERIEEMEDQVLEKPSPELIHALHRYRRDLAQLRRASWPQREILTSMQRDETGIVQEGTKRYLRDCYDHTIQIMDIIESYRELTSSIMEIYLSAVSLRTNDIMRVLTVLSSIFLPLTFLVGVYGMNFAPEAGPWSMPELYWRWGYPVFWAVSLFIAALMLAIFKKNKWL